MTNDVRSNSGPDAGKIVCRRKFLETSLLGAALASATVLSAVGKGRSDVDAPAGGKMSKAAAHYQYHPRGGEQCGGCAHFRPPGSCEIVAGRIVPNGWCRYYERRA